MGHLTDITIEKNTNYSSHPIILYLGICQSFLTETPMNYLYDSIISIPSVNHQGDLHTLILQGNLFQYLTLSKILATHLHTDITGLLYKWYVTITPALWQDYRQADLSCIYQIERTQCLLHHHLVDWSKRPLTVSCTFKTRSEPAKLMLFWDSAGPIYPRSARDVPFL